MTAPPFFLHLAPPLFLATTITLMPPQILIYMHKPSQNHEDVENGDTITGAEQGAKKWGGGNHVYESSVRIY